MCSSMCASPRWSSASSIEPALTARRSIARFSGRPFWRMKYVRPLASVPDLIEGSSGSGADRSCAAPMAADASSTNAARYADRMRLKITRLDPTLPLPGYGSSEAAGFDLAASHDIVVQPGQIALVRTGLIIEVPVGHFLGIFSRSSTPLKRGLLVANGVGVIDPDYSGPTDEIKIQLLNISGNAVQVSRGDRLAQGIVLPAPRVTWDEVTELRSAVRGGFGSTG